MNSRNHNIIGNVISGYAVVFGEMAEDGQFFTHETAFTHKDEPDLKLLWVNEDVNDASEAIGRCEVTINNHGLWITAVINQEIREHLTSGSHFCVMGAFKARDTGEIMQAEIQSIGLTDKPLY